jgi:hypothetical protein
MTQALHEWHEFYLLLGTAGAALLALLFVAVSVGIGFLTEQNVKATRLYMSTVVVHFGSVLFVSAIALAPESAAPLTVWVMGLAGLIGTEVAVVTTIQIFGHQDALITMFDRFAYGVIPAVGQAGIVAAAVMLAAERRWGAEVLAGALLILLLINIRNAWDLVLTLVRQQGRREKSKREKR